MGRLSPPQGGMVCATCRYGSSRLQFRGPARDLSGRYIAVVGGTESYGRFVDQPFAALLERRLGMTVANMACPNAGPDAYLMDEGTLQLLRAAEVAVVQITGAQNMSNAWYRVHPRRNDRFIAAMPQLRALYPEVDFSEIHFTRHLIQTLFAAGEERFAEVATGLRAHWVARMREMLGQLPPRRILFWAASRPPPAGPGTFDVPPALIDREMIAALLPFAAAWVEQVTPVLMEAGHAPQDDLADLCDLPDAAAHRRSADVLQPVIARLLQS